MSTNGDAPFRYRIQQDDYTWIVKLGKPDLDASKLRRFIADQKISGEIDVTVEWRKAGQEPWVGVTTTVDAGTV